MIRALVMSLSVLGLAAWPARANTVSYIRFEEGSGYMANDETGLMDGELLGFPSVAPGAGDTGSEGWSVNVPAATVPLTGAANTGSLRMEGGFVDLSNGNALLLGYSFTIEFFMMPDYPSGGSVAFSLSPLSFIGLALTESLGSLYLNSQFMDTQVYGPATGVHTGVWQHVAMVKQPGEYSIYLDGALIINDTLPDSTDGPYIFPGSITGDRTIGGSSGTWHGYIDEIRISDTALTPGEFLNIPEPSTLTLLGAGSLLWLGRRKREST